MKNQLEKRLQQKDIEATPKTILVGLFALIDEKRNAYEEQVVIYKRKINIYDIRINELRKVLETPADEITIKELKEIKTCIKEYEQKILDARKEIRLILINCNILWKNELKMDKVLEYGLAE